LATDNCPNPDSSRFSRLLQFCAVTRVAAELRLSVHQQPCLQHPTWSGKCLRSPLARPVLTSAISRPDALGFKVWRTCMRLHLLLIENLANRALRQVGQARMSLCRSVLAGVAGEKPRRPRFVRIPQFLCRGMPLEPKSHSLRAL
jgi:hypothetical protein